MIPTCPFLCHKNLPKAQPALLGILWDIASCTHCSSLHPFGQKVSFRIKEYNISPHCTRAAVPLLRGSGQLSWASPHSYTGLLCGCGDVLHLHHACTLFQREQEESFLSRIMTTKYLVTDYIAGQHEPHGNTM